MKDTCIHILETLDSHLLKFIRSKKWNEKKNQKRYTNATKKKKYNAHTYRDTPRYQEEVYVKRKLK